MITGVWKTHGRALFHACTSTASSLGCRSSEGVGDVDDMAVPLLRVFERRKREKPLVNNRKREERRLHGGGCSTTFAVAPAKIVAASSRGHGGAFGKGILTGSLFMPLVWRDNAIESPPLDSEVEEWLCLFLRTMRG
jgi:hypothetical protein